MLTRQYFQERDPLGRRWLRWRGASWLAPFLLGQLTIGLAVLVVLLVTQC